MSYTSDYLGRLNYITYPDGETVSYTYDAGGQVTGVTGERNGLVTKYVKRIGYDEFGQRSFIEYGNGVKTSYTYDENRRWLDAIQTTSGTQKLLQNMKYSFDKAGNVSGYSNDSGNYKTTQQYEYDALYQLVSAKGKTEYKPKWPLDVNAKNSYTSRYEQSWRFDNIGNMKSKYSEKTDTNINPHTSSDLNYSFENFFDENYSHIITRSDNMFFTYDANGNLINETRDRAATLEELKHDVELAEGYSKLNYGIALKNQPEVETKPYSRTYVWNERNQLKSSVEGDFVVNYRYGEDGERAVKSSVLGETLYFNNMFQMSTTAMGMRQTKHIYVGDTRIATKNNWWKDSSTDYEKYNTYWYHGDHLGSAQLVSDYRGEEYERIEYTPYGELWIEKVRNGCESISYRFTGKEMDSETGLYYYGARYLDPKYSRWLSTDPALGEYVSGTSSGEGGIYNSVNLNLYHYAGNNPVKYTCRGAAEGVPGLGVEDGDVPPVHHPLELADQRHVPGELPLADAADEPQEPFPLQKPVDGHHVVGPMGEHGPGGHGEVHEGVVVAQQQIGGLHALHADLGQLVFMGDQRPRRQQPGHGHQVLPHGGPLHIKALYIVQHGVFRLFSRIFSRKSIAPPPGPCQSERGLLEAS